MISEQDLQRLYRAAPTAMLQISRNGLIIENNPAASALLGQPISALAGTPILRWIDEEDRGRAKEHFAQALRGRIAEWPARIVRGNGSTRGVIFRVVAGSLTNRDAPLVVFLQEAKIEQEDRHEVNQIRDLIEHVPGQFISIIEPGSKIIYSGGLARTLWYDDGGWVGKSLSKLLSDNEENAPRFEEMLKKTVEGERWDGILWLLRADSSSVPFQVYAVPFLGRRTNSILGTLLIARDISVEVMGREGFERSRRFSDIGEMTVSIAYELGKPLAQLETLATQLQQIAGEDSEPEAKLLEEIRRIDRLLAGLRAFARDPIAGRRPVRVSSLIEEALAEQNLLLNRARIRVVLTVAEDLPSFHLDRRQIVMVLRTLLENAREAFEGGEAEEERIIELRANSTDDGLIIQCRDNAPSDQIDWVKQAFDPFFTTKAGKMGLGLSIARGIVAEHGGQLWVTRSTDGWTTFTLELPHEPPSQSVVFRMAPLALGRSRSVLVIDDDASIRSLLRRVLERVGYRVSEGWSGRSALAQLASGSPPELVITGLRMRDGSGQWLLDRLARDFPNILSRTVIVTADPSQLIGNELVEEAGCPILRKPVDFQLLLETLDEVSLR